MGSSSGGGLSTCERASGAWGSRLGQGFVEVSPWFEVWTRPNFALETSSTDLRQGDNLFDDFDDITRKIASIHVVNMTSRSM